MSYMMIDGNSLYVFHDDEDTKEQWTIIQANHTYNFKIVYNFDDKKYDIYIVDETDSANNRQLEGVGFRRDTATALSKIALDLNSSNGTTIDFDYFYVYIPSDEEPTPDYWLEDFNYADNTQPEGWTFNYNNGSSTATVLNEKLHVNIIPNNEIDLAIDLPKSFTGSNVTMEFRFTIGNGQLNTWGFFKNDMSYMMIDGNSLFVYHDDEDTREQWTIIQANHTYNFKIVYNFDDKKYDIYIVDETDSDNNRQMEGVGFRRDTATDLSKIALDLNSSNGTTIDFDYFYVYTSQEMIVTGVTDGKGNAIVNNATGVPVDVSIKATFNVALDPESLTNITIGGTAITSTPGADEKTAIITFPDGLDYNTTYTLTIPETVKGYFGDTLSNAYTLTFTTEEEPADIVTVTQIVFTDKNDAAISTLTNNGSVKVTALVKNNSTVSTGDRKVILILALKNSDNMLIDVVSQELTIEHGAQQYMAVGFDLPDNVNGMKCEAFAWNSMPGKPYMEKVVFPQN